MMIIENIPSEIPLIFLEDKVIFPSESPIPPHVTECNKAALSRYEQIKKGSFIVVTPLIPEIVISPVGILCCVENIRFVGSKYVFLTFQPMCRVLISPIDDEPSFHIVKWNSFKEEGIPKEYAETSDFKKELLSLKVLFSEFWKEFKEQKTEKNDADKRFLKSQLIKKALFYIDKLNAENLPFAIDDIMNIMNHISFNDEEVEKIKFAASCCVLVGEEIGERLRHTVEWLNFICRGDIPEGSHNYTKDDLTSFNLNSSSSRYNDYNKRYQGIREKIPEEARKEIEQELARLKRTDKDNAESGRITDHLDWLLCMPWGIYTEDTKDLNQVKEILDDDHAGLPKVKERILEFIAVRQLNPSIKAPILCLVGPPGVGKTSLGKSIARALGRKLARLSVGGWKDEADIRGHNRTYVGALPGKIIQELKRCGSANPVMLLDEIDKIGSSWLGDPEAAFLEVLDPEQNNTFRDRYLDVDYDLSPIFFITTANTLNIRPALLDRMEIIRLPGYTPIEKLDIAQNYLVPRQLTENGFPIHEENRTIDVKFSNGAIQKFIYQYTREAGVRNLERKIAKVLRNIAKRARLGDKIFSSFDGVFNINVKNLHIYGGKSPIIEHSPPGILPPGVMPVLAVSDVGGYVCETEVVIDHHTHFSGRKIKLIGVRKSADDKESVNKIEESFQIAFSALVSHGRILFDDVRKLEKEKGPLYLQASLTYGSDPKDGPSAGIPLLIAIYGAFTGQSVKPTLKAKLLAATGEITLSLGEIRAVGGIRDKILAAHRYGIKRVIIPQANVQDLDDVPQEIKDEVEIQPMSSMWDALCYAYPEDGRLREFAKKQKSQ